VILAALLLASRFELQSNFWMNLHSRLQEAAASKQASSDKAWNDAVDAYRKHFGRRSPVFDAEYMAIGNALTDTPENATPSGIADAVRDALVAAAPLYRKTQWASDDRANRFWIDVARGMLHDTEEELIRGHEAVYGKKWPARIRVDVVPYATPLGAFTTGDTKLTHTTLSSVHPNYRAFNGLELLLHESSHGVFDEELVADRAKLLGVKPPADLWHAILFYTSGELTRRALAARGVPDYKPVAYIVGVYTRRDFPKYLPLLETTWQQYLDGKTTRDAAIDEMITKLTGPAPTPH